LVGALGSLRCRLTQKVVPTSRTNRIVGHRDSRMFLVVHRALFSGAALKITLRKERSYVAFRRLRGTPRNKGRIDGSLSLDQHIGGSNPWGAAKSSLDSNSFQSCGTADNKSTNREGNGPLEQAYTCLDVGERFHEPEIRESKFRSGCPADNFRMALCLLTDKNAARL
jgi:hypothetical protein